MIKIVNNTVPSALIKLGYTPEQVEQIVHKADVVCPYSHSIRGNVDVKLTVA